MKKTAISRAGRSQNLIQVLEYINYLAPAMLLVACAAVWFAAVQVQKAVRAGGETVLAEASGHSSPQLNNVALDAAGYMEAGQTIGRLNAGVVMKYENDKNLLAISITDPALYPEWVYALSTIQSYRKNLIWEATSICVKKCEGGVAAKAELKAYTQQIKLN